MIELYTTLQASIINALSQIIGNSGYDEYGKKIVKRYAFDSLSEAMAVVEKIRRGMVYKRTKGVLRK
jgi:hypothetical protein